MWPEHGQKGLIVVSWGDRNTTRRCLCPQISRNKTGLLSTQDCPLEGMDLKPVLPSSGWDATAQRYSPALACCKPSSHVAPTLFTTTSVISPFSPDLLVLLRHLSFQFFESTFKKHLSIRPVLFQSFQGWWRPYRLFLHLRAPLRTSMGSLQLLLHDSTLFDHSLASGLMVMMCSQILFCSPVSSME